MHDSDALPREAASAPFAQSVRWRNALLWQPSTPGDFDWTPAQVPAGFKLERRTAPLWLRRIVNALQLDGLPDWDKARALASHLTECARDRGAIQSDLRTTYERIRAGYGHCADFARVYLALAHAAGLFARQWAFTHNGFGGNGHVVVEVYDRQRDKWVFLDVHNNFHAVDPVSREPLDALQFRDSVLGGRQALVRRTGAGRPGFEHEHKLWAYYRRGAAEWYLIWGNAVYSYERPLLVRWATRLHPAAGHLLAYLHGVQPAIRVLVTDANRKAVESLALMRRDLRRLLWLGMALPLVAVCGLLGWRAL